MKFIVFFLAVLSAVLLIQSCDSANEDPAAADNTAVPDQPDGISAFTIVRGDTCSEAITEAAVQLRHLLEEASGQKIEIKTDWTKRGAEISRYGREILIGRTNRPESEAVYTEFDRSKEPADYIIRSSGENIVVAATDEAALEAVRIFTESFITIKGDKPAISDRIDLTKTHDFPIDRFEISGHDIGDYTIVYPAAYTEYQKTDILVFRDILYTATGKKLKVLPETETASPPRINIGTAGGATFDGTHPLDYRIRTESENLSIGGSNYYADIKAIYRFLYDTAGYSYDGSFHKNEVILTGSDDINRYNDIKILIGAWCTSGDAIETEAQIRDMAEAGFNHVNIQVPADRQLMHRLLKWLAVYNLECLWFDGSVYADFATPDFAAAADYIGAPVSWGNYLYDEPNSDKFGQLADAYALYKEKHGKEPFINLFPMYASETQLGNPTYTEHVNQYLDTVKPALCSVDIYPLDAYGLYPGYMKNLDIVATAARQRNIPLSVYIQSVSFAESKRTPSYADLEWQAYSCLSFGAAGIIYFTYVTPYSDAESFKPALIDHEGNKTERWYFAQKLNAEIAFFADAFAGYKNLGAFSHNSSPETGFLEFENQYKNFKAIKDIVCDNPLLFGCFENNDSYAFTAVNMTNLQMSRGISDVRVKTDSTAVMYKNNESVILLPDDEGYISFSLDVGEGVFCTLNQE